jgi:hypothetical protein
VAERQKSRLTDKKIERHRKQRGDEHVGKGILPAYAEKRRHRDEYDQKSSE